MRKHLKVVEQNRASGGVRFVEYIIDSLFLNLVPYIIIYLISLVVMMVVDVDLWYLNSEFEENHPFLNIFIGLVIFSIYYIVLEFSFDGRTVGKYVMGTKVVSIDGEKPSLKQVLIRTLSRIVPFDGLSFLGNNGWHDSWSETRVVKISNFERARSIELDINSIGKVEEA